MTRTLVFKPWTDAADPERVRFALLINKFLSGGNLLHFNPQTGGQTARKPEDRRCEAKFVRAYKSISNKHLNAEGKDEGELRLKPEGGTLTLDQPTFALLERYLDAAPTVTQEADVFSDLLDWVSAADKKD